MKIYSSIAKSWSFGKSRTNPRIWTSYRGKTGIVPHSSLLSKRHALFNLRLKEDYQFYARLKKTVCYNIKKTRFLTWRREVFMKSFVVYNKYISNYYLLSFSLLLFLSIWYWFEKKNFKYLSLYFKISSKSIFMRSWRYTTKIK